MKDPEGMNEEEKRKYYIFEDTSFEGRPSDNWITECLLGDIRTFLDGIENRIREKHAGKLFSDGFGNLSVPILISTALEFVAKLYSGKTEYTLCFSKEISEELREEWKQLKIDSLMTPLKEIFDTEGFKLPERTTIASISKKVIEIDEYVIKKEGEKLKVYENYNATDNVIKFIKDFFPKEYKEIPRLLWDGIRNGLVHTFYPKSFSFQGNGQSLEEGRIQFQFYVEDQNSPSHIKKVNDTIRISINVFELYRVLEKAIEDYLDELQHNEELQKKFIKAWSSIKQYVDEADNNQSDEARKLNYYLGSSSAKLILEDLNKVMSMDLLKIYSLKVRRS